VEDLETILELDDKHLEQMGVPMGHKLKLVKRIKEIRVSKGLHVPPSRQGGERDKPKPTAPASTTKVEPNANSGGVGTENQEKKQSTSEGGVGGENTLLDGFYDEEEQARQFQAALNAWRTGGAKQEEKKEEKQEKKVSSICRFMCVARAVCWGVRG
jgi:hypothetical protein